ncbi:MAG: nucleotide exchange factor GrpE [Thermomicrobium sp.]|nr:nucleotide exchange factor GrpE [Thermomicrobium sp.]MDW8060487.1 nucleotide exchange factor GrpE [Thermomicrobium sp.]
MTEHDRPEWTGEAAAGAPGQVGEPVSVPTDLATSETVQEPSLPTDELAALRAENEHLKQLVEDYLDQARRARAEFLNYKRRVEHELEEFKHLAHLELIRKLLPVLDDFHLAIAHLPDEAKDNPWVQGLLLIERKLWAVLEQEGVEPIEVIGKPFRPEEHEAVAVSGEGPHHVVVEELRRGYRVRGRILRPALVRVERRPAPPETETPTNDGKRGEE